MNIATTDAQGIYNKRLVASFVERVQPRLFLGTFFKDVPPVATLELSIEVQRGTEKIAVDVTRGTDGNRNEFTKSTEKIFIPPYFREYWDRTSLDFYERLWGSTEISDAMFAQLVNSGADKTAMLRDKIDRTYEKMRAEILQTGTLTYRMGPTIDFKRKAGSMVDLTVGGGGGYWTVGATDVFTQLDTAARWLRQNGKTATETFDVILGTAAKAALFANTTFLARQNLFNLALDNIRPPQRNNVGATYHGMMTGGSYMFRIWTYDEYYEDAAGVMQPYIDPKKGIVLPSDPNLIMAYAAVPQLTEPGQAPSVGKFVITDYIDEKRRTHEYHIESAGMPIPVGIDQMYTFKAVA